MGGVESKLGTFLQVIVEDHGRSHKMRYRLINLEISYILLLLRKLRDHLPWKIMLKFSPAVGIASSYVLL